MAHEMRKTLYSSQTDLVPKGLEWVSDPKKTQQGLVGMMKMPLTFFLKKLSRMFRKGSI